MKIIHLDGSEGFQKVFKRTVERRHSGAEVKSFSDAPSALRAVRDLVGKGWVSKLSVVVEKGTVSQMKGTDFLRTVREEFAGVRCALFVLDARDADVVAVAQDLAIPIFKKPGIDSLLTHLFSTRT